MNKISQWIREILRLECQRSISFARLKRAWCWRCCCSVVYVGLYQGAEITVHNLKCISAVLSSRSKYSRNWWQKYATTKYQPHQSLVLICWQNDDESDTEGICLPVSAMKTVPRCSYVLKDSQGSLTFGCYTNRSSQVHDDGPCQNKNTLHTPFGSILI